MSKNPMPILFGRNVRYRVRGRGLSYHPSLGAAIAAAMKVDVSTASLSIAVRLNDEYERIALRTRDGFRLIPLAALVAYRAAQQRAAEALEEIEVLEDHNEALRLALVKHAGGEPIEDLSSPPSSPMVAQVDKAQTEHQEGR